MNTTSVSQFQKSVIFIASTLKVLKKYRLFIISVFVLFLSLAVLLKFLSSKVFKTELIATSSLVTSERMTILIDPLGRLAEEGNHKELGHLMNLDSTTASHIVDIVAKELKDESKVNSSENYDGELLRQQNCLVTLKVKEPRSIMDTIQSGILYYLRNNEYIKRRSSIERNNLIFMQTRIRNEIKELDQMKDKINFLKSGMSLLDPSAINNSIANLYGQELSINGKIMLEDQGINIIRNVTYFKKPVSPKLWLNIFIALFASAIVSGVYIIYKEALSYYNEIEK